MKASKRILSAVKQSAADVLRKGLLHFFCAVTGFLLSGVDFADCTAPFGLGFVGGADMEYTLSASLGASAGYLVFGSPSGALKMISAAALVCFVKLGTAKLFRRGRLIYLYTASVFAASFVCALTVTAVNGIDAAVFLTDLCSALIAGAGTCFFYRMFCIFGSGSGGYLSLGDFTSLLFSAAVILLSLTRMPYVGADIAHCAAAFFIMLAALCGSEYASPMAGICFGVTLGHIDMYPHFLSAFALSGLLCGICGDHGKAAVAVGLGAAELLSLMLCGSDDTALASVLSAVAAILVFVCIPQNRLFGFTSHFLPSRREHSEEEQRKLIRYRLHSAAKAVHEVGNSVKTVAEALMNTDASAGGVRTDACEKCFGKKFCWEQGAELAAMQFAGASAVLEDAAEGLSSVGRCDPQTAAAAKDVLDDFGFEADPVIAYSDSRGRSTVEAFCAKMPGMTDFAELADCLYEKTGVCYLDPVTDRYSDLGTVLSFCEASELSADIYVARRTGSGEIYCGDTCESFTDGHGNFCVVLSDGMGRGKRAALDSAMACSLTSRLIRAGFSLDCAVNAVNSALMMKSADETLSTLDILKIDLTDGTAGFYKAGAAGSVVYTGGHSTVIEKSSLPLGILKEVGLEHSVLKLRSGDRVILMSDGASVLPPMYFCEMLENMKDNTLEELAETVAEDAVRYSHTGDHDDITVACIGIVG